MDVRKERRKERGRLFYYLITFLIYVRQVEDKRLPQQEELLQQLGQQPQPFPLIRTQLQLLDFEKACGSSLSSASSTFRCGVVRQFGMASFLSVSSVRESLIMNEINEFIKATWTSFNLSARADSEEGTRTDTDSTSAGTGYCSCHSLHLQNLGLISFRHNQQIF